MNFYLFKKTIVGAFVIAISMFFTTSAQSFAYSDGSINYNLSVPTVPISGTALTTGARYRIDNMAVIQSRTIYGILTIVDKPTTAIFTNIDAPGGTNTGTNENFQPVITSTGTNVFVTFKLEFFDQLTNFPVYLSNFYLSGLDVDGNSAANTEAYRLPQSEYTSYTVNNPSSLVVSTQGLDTQFRGNSTNLAGITFENTSSFYALYNNPKTSLTFKMGTVGTVTDPRQFSMKMGTPAGTFTTPVTTANATTFTRSNLSITKTVNNTYPVTGGTVIYTLTATNAAGSAPATNVIVGDKLPSGLTFSSASSANYVASTGIWTIGNLAAGATQTLTINATVNASTNAMYSNSAGITSDEIEVATSNNRSTADIIPNPKDSDGDGTPDFADSDSDNDGLPDTVENACETEGTPVYNENFGTGATGTNANVINHTYQAVAPPDGSYTVTTSGAQGTGTTNTYARTDLNGERDAANTPGVAASAGTTTGRYLFINVNSPESLNLPIYTVSNVVVTSGTKYRFRIDMAGLANAGADVPRLQLSIRDANGNLLASANSTSIGMANDDIWRRLSLGFVATTSTVTIQIVNLQPTGGSGNDLAIDNVVLVPLNICDADGDGIENSLDLDSDNDGILDSAENVCVTRVEGSPVFRNDFGTGSASTADEPYVVAHTRVTGDPGDGFYIVTNSTDRTAPYAKTNQTGNLDAGYNAITGGSLAGRYLMINIDSPGRLNLPIYRIADLPVVSGAAYRFRIDMAGLADGATAVPSLQLTLRDAGNNVLATANSSSLAMVNDDVWRRLILDFVATSNVVTLEIVNLQGNGGGNDLGLDNIVLAPLFCDLDGDLIPNYLDTDSDGDGCADAIEGTETVRFNQIHSLTLPVGNANYAYRGQIKMIYDGVTTGTPAQVISTSTTANGVPQLVNNAGNNLNATTNPSNLVGLADNTDGSADIGQGIGTSQNNAVKDIECDRCFRPATTTGTTLPTNHGITALGRAGSDNGNWPMKINGAYTALDAKTKGFVINRLPFTGSPSVPTGITAANYVVGMMVYDTTNNCLKIYDGTGWYCYTKQTCDNINQ